MFLVDDILLSPVKGIVWIMKQVHKAVQEEMDHEEDRIVQQLSELYMQLETGRITEDEFDAREEVLLDRLDEIRNQSEGDQLPKHSDDQEAD